MIKKLSAFLLAAVMAAMTACGASDSGAVQTQPADNAGAAETAAETSDNAVTFAPDNLPDNLDFGGRTIHIFVSGSGNNEAMFKGPDEETGEIEKDTVILRNRNVEERLNIKLDYFGEPTGGWDTIYGLISKLIQSGDETYDIYLGNQYGFVSIITLGGIVDTYELEGLDFSQPWWNNQYMDELMPGKDHRYFFAGDFTMDIVQRAHVLFFNRDYYRDVYGDPSGLYDAVFGGSWTIDMLSKTAEGAYMDLNNNGQTDPEDRLGYVTYAAGASVDPFAYLGDVPYAIRDENGDIMLNMVNDQAVTLTEKVVHFFYQPGSIFNTKEDISGSTFKNGNAMFLGIHNLANAAWFRDMEDDFGFLPYPKLNEEQERYHALVADIANIGAIPALAPNLDIIGTVLEALCSETYRTLMPTWYETSLKIKYSRDDIDARVVDIVHDASTTNFLFAYSQKMNGLGQILRELVGKNSIDYTSAAEKKIKSGQKALQKILDGYNNI